MLEDTNSLDGAHLLVDLFNYILGKKETPLPDYSF